MLFRGSMKNNVGVKGTDRRILFPLGRSNATSSQQSIILRLRLERRSKILARVMHLQFRRLSSSHRSKFGKLSIANRMSNWILRVLSALYNYFYASYVLIKKSDLTWSVTRY